jgi:hypothetical protein
LFEAVFKPFLTFRDSCSAFASGWGSAFVLKDCCADCRAFPERIPLLLRELLGGDFAIWVAEGNGIIASGRPRTLCLISLGWVIFLLWACSAYLSPRILNYTILPALIERIPDDILQCHGPVASGKNLEILSHWNKNEVTLFSSAGVIHLNSAWTQTMNMQGRDILISCLDH